MDFYKECFGGELKSTTVGDSPAKEQFPPALHERVLNANLVSDLVDISASDWLHPTEKPNPGNTVCLYISDGTYDSLKKIFDKLVVGAKEGSVTQLEQQHFGTYGALTDKFHVRWMFQGDKQA